MLKERFFSRIIARYTFRLVLKVVRVDRVARDDRVA